MLNPEEQAFVAYWKENRIRKRLRFRQLAVGMPLGVILVFSILLNFFSGWYKRADMQINSMTPGQMLAIIAAGIGIILFITIFSAKHRWDINENYYRELIAKSEKEN